MEELGLSEILMDFTRLPEKVILDLSKPVRKIFSVFEPNPMNLIGPEYVIDQAIEACTCRISTDRDIAMFARRLMRDLQEVDERRKIAMQEFGRNPDYLSNHEFSYPAVHQIERAVTVEQATLDMRDEFIALKLYLANQYLPYRYETMIGNGSAVLLMKFQSAEEFFDRIAYLNA